ncbi:gamma-glutamylcyclotransferase family protein [Pukyongiella litopenaei]|uniref:Gamma-glutamylcyclotransferase n=1 Tax=Pukyongiella litopenaei TaxID=2605946 RepID=A0A2S0MP06_9RHOB|nr:gamma-glutamylcyclotransferase family protein [Pukyongiella litopenaei]AVO37620.1 gamma-glutamylcyclotransferase [Pukyongiella litopenaei]
MSDPHFFGYGSLVNRATHAYPDLHRARLRGWRRAWAQTSLRSVAFLTIVPADPQAEIDGLTARVPGSDWAALDAREWAYDRITVTAEVTHPAPHPREIAVYSVPPRHRNAPGGDHPILLSYLDVVVQGYLREFGEPGAARFFASTDGWQAPVLDDRAAPRYPRHQRLTEAETALVDDLLGTCGATIITAA